MPELPEVETTRRGLLPHLRGHRLGQLQVHQPRLRWPVPDDLGQRLAGRTVVNVERRAKYLLLRLDGGDTLIIHLGMSGSLRLESAKQPRRGHDHLELSLVESDLRLRYHDPRRFGSWLWQPVGEVHPLLRQLGPEPLSAEFQAESLWRGSRGRRAAVKLYLMDQATVVGVGNIYASESLFRAGIDPRRAAGRVSLARYEALVEAVRTVLGRAIEEGGTTLRDYLNPEGTPGYFAQSLDVYERGGAPCHRCGTAIRRVVLGQRASYYCPSCQR
ncbi:MAG: bifunctional DNA-formamidopyrimidine glycosylase/DNA-(apurinic or apyrimidinic site) lyase [Lysobacterales bacterium]